MQLFMVELDYLMAPEYIVKPTQVRIAHLAYLAGVEAFEDGEYATAVDQLTTFIGESRGLHQAEGYALRAAARFEHRGLRARRTILRDLDRANELDETGLNILVINLWLRGRMADPVGLIKAIFLSVKVRK